ncbi:uncharacterized protein LOC126738616 isoform X1 [Anthonomus grandis grandis]|uniref:uncharacterized protein LOC126738616 isoform X1 n=3 Tax=Anthonomus grandis grandis TaxID=2921223 RepID=UPI0021660C68|nr:uncharacterized protein LOC126738616 isoform X1 [Anthonomus grandis grandis]XP_050299988.1 uncharacterized protein LOC126738616 isoform X1 [Anthonomus grandis grandis]XP_050299989.1 uncharacterized protein LOC126738616 isoform X1 [Anthonomus grandis grandis]
MDTILQTINSASLADCVRRYERLMVKKTCKNTSIYFNNQCLKWKLTPKYIHIKLNQQRLSNRNSRLLNTLRGNFIREEIRKSYIIINNIDIQLKCIYDRLRTGLSFQELNNILGNISCKMQHLKNTKIVSLQRKLSKLKQEKQIAFNRPSIEQFDVIHKFHKPCLNFSNTTFNNKELALLSRGLKYRPVIHNKKEALQNLEMLTVETETVLQNIEADNINQIRAQCSNILRTELKSIKNAPNKTEGDFNSTLIKSIKNKLQNSNLTLTKADKGNCVVILNKNDYDTKVTQFIQENNFRKQSARLPSFIKKVNDTLKFCTNLINPQLRYFLSANNTNVPKLYGLLKVHKSDIPASMPIRPVVAYTNSPTYKLAKWLNNHLITTIDCHFPYTIKNNIQLVDKIKDIIIPENAFFISLDVTNLFTNIPIFEVVDIIKNKLFNSTLTNIETQEIINILEICLKQNFFNFDNETYIQEDGLAMGSPLSPLLADTFMNHFESNNILNNNPYLSNILYYYRYVDDCILLWNGNKQHLSDFLSFINNIHPKIKFTLEVEINKTITFLDLLIKNVNNKHDFEIYRKPSHTGTIIHNESFHPFSHKAAALNSYVNRALQIPQTTESRDRELNIIKQIAQTHNFSPNLVDKIKNKFLLRNAFQNVYIPHQTILSNQPVNKFISLTYNGAVSYKIQRVLTSLNVKVAFKSSNSLGNLLINNKDKTDPLSCKGIYKLYCECGYFYVGRTKRSFKARFSEHDRCIRQNNPESLFAKHIMETGHPSNLLDNYKILHRVQDNINLNNLELLEIKRSLKKEYDKSLNIQINIPETNLINILFE